MPEHKFHYVDCSITVRYCETDAMKVAYYANYPVWFEAGRGEYGRKRNLPYTEFEESGYYGVVAECYCRYIRSAGFNDSLIIRTWISEMTSRTMKFEYKILNADNMELLATGYTKHVCISLDGKVSKLPPKWLEYRKNIRKSA